MRLSKLQPRLLLQISIFQLTEVEAEVFKIAPLSGFRTGTAKLQQVGNQLGRKSNSIKFLKQSKQRTYIMADERIRTKSELKRLFTGLINKPITDEMMSVAIDSLWRDKITQRTGGFFHAGSFDSEISFDLLTQIFTIKPFDPEVDGYIPRFLFYSWSTEAILHRIYDALEIEIPREEGLFCIYFDNESETNSNQVLTIAKNPTIEQLQLLYSSKVIVSFIYWDAENQELVYFGDDRHGSEWNPQLRWYLHKSFAARRKTGLQLSDFVINGDGSLNSHAQFRISAGTILHDDFELEIPASTTTIPIVFCINGASRIAENYGYSVLKGNNRLLYNDGLTQLTEAASGNFVIYHYFATNEISNASRKIISVMGTSQYASLQAAFTGNRAELNDIETYIPMQGRCYIDSAIFQTSDNYTNSDKARIVGFVRSLWPEVNEYVTEMLQGDIDGVNTFFTTSKPYASGKITVLLNGLKEYQFSEINETTVQLFTSPENAGFTDVLECIYKLK
jgi:hypothetical protein